MENKTQYTIFSNNKKWNKRSFSNLNSNNVLENATVIYEETDLFTHYLKNYSNNINSYTQIAVNDEIKKISPTLYTVDKSNIEDSIKFLFDANHSNIKTDKESVKNIFYALSLSVDDLEPIEYAGLFISSYKFKFLYLYLQAIEQHALNYVFIHVYSNSVFQIGNENISVEKSILFSFLKEWNKTSKYAKAILYDFPVGNVDQSFSESISIIASLNQNPNLVENAQNQVYVLRNSNIYTQYIDSDATNNTTNEPISSNSKITFSKNENIIIFGEISGLMVNIVSYLVSKYNSSITICYRKQFPQQSDWSSWIKSHASEHPVSKKITLLQKLKSNLKIIPIHDFMTNEMEINFNYLEKEASNINSIIHISDLVEINSLQEMNIEHFLSTTNMMLFELLLSFHIASKYSTKSIYSILGIEYILDFSLSSDSTFMSSFLESYTKYLSSKLQFHNVSSLILGPIAEQDLFYYIHNFDNLNNFSYYANFDDIFEKYNNCNDKNSCILSLENIAVLNSIYKKISKEAIYKTQAEFYKKQNYDNVNPPRDEYEVHVLKSFESVLGITINNIYTNFFDYGGNSLTAIDLLSDLRSYYEIDLAMNIFFQKPTIYDLSEQIKLEILEKYDSDDFEKLLQEVEAM